MEGRFSFRGFVPKISFIGLSCIALFFLFQLGLSAGMDLFSGRMVSWAASGTCTRLSPISGNNNQDQINAALAKGGTVHLGAGTYVINKKIYIGVSNTTLEGEKGTIIKLVDHANWAADSEGKGAMIQTSKDGLSNIRITGFEVDGNRANNTSSTLSTRSGNSIACGQNFYSELYAHEVNGMEIDHMYLHDNWNDTFKVDSSANVSFHDNTVRNPGHDIVYATKCTNVKCYNNYVQIYCNSAFRSYASPSMQVYDNLIGDESSSGWIGIEVQSTGSIQLNNNIFTINGGGNGNISGTTSTNSSLKAPWAPEYPATDSTGKSILNDSPGRLASTGKNSGSDGTSNGAGGNACVGTVTEPGGDAGTGYALTVTGGTGSGKYESGAVVTITASSQLSGTTFDKWTGDTSYIESVSSATTTLTMPAKAITLTAVYKYSSTTKYALNVVNGTGDGGYVPGTTVTIVANPPISGRVFDRWTGDADVVASVTSSTTTLTMPAKGVNITATYKDAASGDDSDTGDNSGGDGDTEKPTEDKPIVDGSIIRGAGDVDVYVVKFVGDKMYKRLILSPSVFRSYGHLKWENIVVIDSSSMADYVNSELVHMVGTKKVWLLQPSGDTGMKTLFIGAYDPDSVYEINAADFNSYVG